MEAAIVINTGENRYVYPRGILGTYIVPGKEGRDFGLLVVYSRGELQDIGNGQRKIEEAIPARSIAEDILGFGSERKEKFGLLLCAAEPEVPKDLERAIREEKDFLNAHPPDVRMKKNPVLKMTEAVNMQDAEPGVRDQKIKLSKRVQDERRKFEESCRKLVTKEEIAKSQANRMVECKRLFQEAEHLWARPATRNEVTAVHQQAARELHRQAEWCYDPKEMEDCEACGVAVNKGVAICSHCGAILDDAKARKFHVGPYALKAAAAAAPVSS